MNKLTSFLQTHKRIILLLSLAFFVRIIPACLFIGSCDSFIAEDMYYNLKNSIKAGGIGNFAHDAGLHFPGWQWLLLIIGLSSELTGTPYRVLFKFPAIFADLAITILIYKTFLNLGSTPKESSKLAAAYALTPIVIIISAINGQFDSLTIFLCLLAWYLYIFRKRFKIGSAIFLGLGVIIKEFPALLFPVFWGKTRQMKERIGYLGYFLLPIFIALVVAYFTTTLKFIPCLLRYQSSSGFWGISLISMYLANNLNNSFFTGLNLFVKQYMRYISLSIIVFIWTMCFNKKIDTLTLIVLISTTFYFIAPGLAAQYLLWIIPFAVIRKDQMLKFYTIFASMVVILWFAPNMHMKGPPIYYNPIKWLNVTRNIFSILGWATSGIWMYRLLKEYLFVRWHKVPTLV